MKARIIAVVALLLLSLGSLAQLNNQVMGRTGYFKDSVFLNGRWYKNLATQTGLDSVVTDQSKVKITSGDNSSGYLTDKLLAGVGLSKAIAADGFGNETLSIVGDTLTLASWYKLYKAIDSVMKNAVTFLGDKTFNGNVYINGATAAANLSIKTSASSGAGFALIIKDQGGNDALVLRDDYKMSLGNGSAIAAQFVINSTNAGSGIYSPSYSAGPDNTIKFKDYTTGTTRWQINASGHLLAGTDNTYDFGTSGATRARNGYFAGTLYAAGFSPNAHNTTDLASAGVRFKDGYFAGSVYAGNYQRAVNGFYVESKALYGAAADGVLTLDGNAVHDIRVQFGGTSSAYPALNRSTTNLLAKLADNSGWAGFQAGTGTFNGQLEVNSTTAGFLPPRMNEVQKLGISSPSTGLIVYQTDAFEGLYVAKSGAAWHRLITESDAGDFVTYTGASAALDLGSQNLTTTGNVTFGGSDYITIAGGVFGVVNSSGAYSEFRYNSLVFNQVSGGTFSMTMQHAALTGSRTITIPNASGTLMLENAVSGTFTTTDGKTVTVTNGRVTSIL